MVVPKLSFYRTYSAYGMGRRGQLHLRIAIDSEVADGLFSLNWPHFHVFGKNNEKRSVSSDVRVNGYKLVRPGMSSVRV